MGLIIFVTVSYIIGVFSVTTLGKKYLEVVRGKIKGFTVMRTNIILTLLYVISIVLSILMGKIYIAMVGIVVVIMGSALVLGYLTTAIVKVVKDNVFLGDKNYTKLEELRLAYYQYKGDDRKDKITEKIKTRIEKRQREGEQEKKEYDYYKLTLRNTLLVMVVYANFFTMIKLESIF